MEEIIKPIPSVELVFWSQESLVNTSSLEKKVNLIEIQPNTASIILCQHSIENKADKDSILSKWDVNQRRCIWKDTYSNILAKLGAPNTQKSSNPTISVNQSSISYTTHDSHSISPIQSIDVVDFYSKTQNVSKEGYKNDLSEIRKAIRDAWKEDIKDDINNLDFIYISNWYDIFGDIQQLLFPYDEVISNSTIILVCQNGIICYDFLSYKIQYVTSQNDLNGKSINFVEYISSNLLAIGCNDGTIRLWDTTCWKGIGIKNNRLDIHSKGGEVIYLKNIIETKTISNTPPNHMIEYIRFLSIGSDGNGYIWEGNIADNNMITIDPPIARLDDSSGGKITVLGLSSGSTGSIGRNMNVFVDKDTNSLSIVGIDRIIRAWSLENLQNSNKSTNLILAASIKSTRSSLTFSSNPDPNSNIPKLPCISKVKPSIQLISSLSKYTSLSTIFHPIYANPSYVITGGGQTGTMASIGIVQSCDSLLREESSERTSIITTGSNSNQDTGQKMSLLYEISLSSLLIKYLTLSSLLTSDKERATTTTTLSITAASAASAATTTTNESSSNTTTKAKKLVSNPFVTQFNREVTSIKCYSVQTSIVWPDRLIVATSLGVMVIQIRNIQNGSFLGQHPLWKDIILSYSNRGILRSQIQINDSKQFNTARSSLVPIEDEYSVSGLDQGMNVIYALGSNLTSLTASRRASSITTTTTEIYPNIQSCIISLSLSLNLQSTLTTHKIAITRPTFLVSPSGRYVAALWENTNYVLFKVSILMSSSVPSKLSSTTATSTDKKSMIELERGLCQSFAWVGINDQYIIITPYTLLNDTTSEPIKLNRMESSRYTNQGLDNINTNVNINPNASSRSSVTSLFGGKKTEVIYQKSIKSSKAICKQIYADNNDSIVKLNLIDMVTEGSSNSNSSSSSSYNATSISSSFDIHRSKYCFSGPILCCNYISRTSLSNTSTTTNTNTPLIDVKDEVYGKPDCCQFVLLSSVPITPVHTSEDSLVSGISQSKAMNLDVSVTSIGPILPACDMISWDYNTGLCSMLIHDTINILQLSSSSSSSTTIAASINLSSTSVTRKSTTKLPMKSTASSSSSSSSTVQQNYLVLETIASVNIAAYSLTRPVVASINWQPYCYGLLIISTSVNTIMISCPRFHHPRHKTSPEGMNYYRKAVDVIVLASDSKSSQSLDPMTKTIYCPKGYHESILIHPNIHRGYTILLSSDGFNLLTLPLSQCPMAIILYFLSSLIPSASEKALTWMGHWPRKYDDYMGALLLKRGYLEEAIRLPKVSHNFLRSLLKVIKFLATQEVSDQSRMKQEDNTHAILIKAIESMLLPSSSSSSRKV